MKNMTDPEKLRAIVAWFDKYDLDMHGFDKGREVQVDLIRIAGMLEKTDEKVKETVFVTKNMIKSILSACIQYQKESVSAEEIKKFFRNDYLFDDAFRLVLPCLTIHMDKDGNKAYSIRMKRENRHGEVYEGYGILDVINPDKNIPKGW